MLRTSLVVLLASFIGVDLGSAQTITITESAMASGSLNGTAYTDSLITLTASGDISNVVTEGPGIFELPVSGLSIDIASLDAVATLTDAAHVFSCQSCTAAGISDNGSDDILDTFASAFSSYSITTSFGPITSADNGAADPDVFFDTDDGPFQITSADSTTFTATLGETGTATPEPAAIALSGLGLAGLAGLAVFKRRNAQPSHSPKPSH
jgi:hypothetical protein